MAKKYAHYFHSSEAYDSHNKYRCCCNTMHVEKGAYIIAIIGIVVAGLCAFANCFILTWPLNWPLFAVNLVSMVSYLCIIWARRQRQPGLYLPFLVVQAICLLLLIALLVLLLYPIFIVRKEGSQEPWNEQHKEREQVLYVTLALPIIITLITLLLSLWFYTIVFRAYKFMKDQHHSRTVTTVPPSAPSKLVHEHEHDEKKAIVEFPPPLVYQHEKKAILEIPPPV